MNESKVNKVNKVKVEKGSKNSTEESNKRYKSKKAEEYAEEHGLTLEDFDINEISKILYIRRHNSLDIYNHSVGRRDIRAYLFVVR